MEPPRTENEPGPAYVVELVERPEQPALVVAGHVERNAVGPFLDEGFGEVAQAAAAGGVELAGPPFARYTPHDDGSFDIECGFPIHGEAQATGRVVPTTLHGGPVAQTTHTGDYDAVEAAYAAVGRFLAENGREVTGAPWETYLDEPSVPAPRTEVCFPCSA